MIDSDISPRRIPRVAYVMSRFPKLTETFVLDEMIQMQQLGVDIEVYPLWREKETTVHTETQQFVAKANYLPTLNLEILRDNIYWLYTTPVLYLLTLLRVCWANRSSLRYLAGSLAVFPKAATFARRMLAHNVSHIHAHFASHPAAAAFIVNKLSGIPWSFTAHGSDLHRCQAMLEDKVRSAAFTVTVSSYNKKFILDHTDRALAERIHVIHCGVDHLRFCRPVDAAAPSGTTNIVCIGTLHGVKGQWYLLHACANLPVSNWHCHLIGDGPDRSKLEALAKQLRICDKVTFHGSCARERVLELLQQMDICCVPSVPTEDGRREGIPVAMMEAAAFSIPIVASNLSGIPEFVVHQETGLLCEPKDTQAITGALFHLIEHEEERRHLGQQARQKLVKEFSLKETAASLYKLIATGPASC
jgi:glycosyltransferase involved in cell wall biosynthesis